MDKEWVEKRKAERAAVAQAKYAEIVEKINDAMFLTEKYKKLLEETIEKEYKEYGEIFDASVTVAFYGAIQSDKEDWESIKFTDVRTLVDSLGLRTYGCLLREADGDWLSDRYLDSEPMEFDGDIIITDPCYIIRAEHHGTTPVTDDDWDACHYGSNMEVLGINQYMTRDTIYGDWGCTVYNTDTDQPIGEFCADAGLVSVFLLDEVLKYNPDFDYHKERKWTTTLIPDFKGTVQFVVERIEEVHETDCWEDFSVHVIGHGINKKTGKPINFRSIQSSL